MSNYRGNKRLDYTKIHRERTTNNRYYQDNISYGYNTIKSSPRGYSEVIIEWLDNNLSKVVKDGIGFNNRAFDTIVYRCGRRQAELSFGSTNIRFTVRKEYLGDVERETVIDYCHPKMFEYLKLAITRFYNGI